MRTEAENSKRKRTIEEKQEKIRRRCEAEFGPCYTVPEIKDLFGVKQHRTEVYYIIGKHSIRPVNPGEVPAMYREKDCEKIAKILGENISPDISKIRREIERKYGKVWTVKEMMEEIGEGSTKQRIANIVYSERIKHVGCGRVTGALYKDIDARRVIEIAKKRIVKVKQQDDLYSINKIAEELHLGWNTVRDAAEELGLTPITHGKRQYYSTEQKEEMVEFLQKKERTPARNQRKKEPVIEAKEGNEMIKYGANGENDLVSPIKEKPAAKPQHSNGTGFDKGDKVRFNKLEVNIEVPEDVKAEPYYVVEDVYVEAGSGYVTIKCKGLDRYYAAQRFEVIEKGESVPTDLLSVIATVMKHPEKEYELKLNKAGQTGSFMIDSTMVMGRIWQLIE